MFAVKSHKNDGRWCERKNGVAIKCQCQSLNDDFDALSFKITSFEQGVGQTFYFRHKLEKTKIKEKQTVIVSGVYDHKSQQRCIFISFYFIFKLPGRRCDGRVLLTKKNDKPEVSIQTSFWKRLNRPGGNSSHAEDKGGWIKLLFLRVFSYAYLFKNCWHVVSNS